MNEELGKMLDDFLETYNTERVESINWEIVDFAEKVFALGQKTKE